MAQEKPGSLQETPTWAVSIVCLIFFLLSLSIDAGLHHLTQFLRRKKRKSLNKALEKIKTEMMIMGFISLLLTLISEVPLSKICVTEAVANSFLPCTDSLQSTEEVAFSSATQFSKSKSNVTLLSVNATEAESYCLAKGMVALVSREGIMELRIFISVLAVFHIFSCILTMFLGSAKMRKWKAWEEETQTLEYEINNDPARFRFARQTSFGRRHLKLQTDYPLLLWPVCFVRQFRGSVSKADYFILRNGFIKANCTESSNFNFQRFLARALDDDFEHVVGISSWIWIYSILFIFFSAHGFYNHYWLPFIPLMIVLVVGTKLEGIMTEMCSESSNKNSVIQGTFLVKPNNDFFWFGRPMWLLHLLQFILIQSSFQLAFFAWTWYEYGPRSCFNRQIEDIVIRISTGVFVQFLCGYVTLPLYALVTQMGSGMKAAVFTERVAEGLKHWCNNARRRLSKNRSTSTKHLLAFSWNNNATETSTLDMQNSNVPKYEGLPPSAVKSSPSGPEILEEAGEQNSTPTPAETSCSTSEIKEDEAHPKIRGIYDGEISFRNSWKK